MLVEHMLLLTNAAAKAVVDTEALETEFEQILQYHVDELQQMVTTRTLTITPDNILRLNHLFNVYDLAVRYWYVTNESKVTELYRAADGNTPEALSDHQIFMDDYLEVMRRI